MVSKELKGKLSKTPSEKKELVIEQTATNPKQDLVKTQKLALFHEAARQILEKNVKIESAISVKDMEDKKRREYLDELRDYQTRKEHIYFVIIGYWLITIMLGLLAMVLVKQITEVGVFVIWGGLLLSNILLVVGHKFYEHSKALKIIEKYAESSQPIVIVNNNIVTSDTVSV